MEPFALMQFLQSLFTQNPQNPPQNTDVSETETPPQANPINPSTPSNVAEEKTEQAASKQSDAILDFIQKHETRAKRIRKD